MKSNELIFLVEEISRQHSAKSVVCLVLITLCWCMMRRSKRAIKKHKLQLGEEKSTRKIEVTANTWDERGAAILKDVST